VLKACSQFALTFSTDSLGGLYLWSAPSDTATGVGTGKTGLAIGLMRLLISLGAIERDCLFVKYDELVAAGRKAHNEESDYRASKLVTRILEADLVVIDEFGAMRATEFSTEFTRWLVDQLWQNKQHLIVTSNFSPTLIKSKFAYDEDRSVATTNAIVSRLHGLCHVIEVVGRDYRLR